jgi:MFS family permease
LGKLLCAAYFASPPLLSHHLLSVVTQVGTGSVFFTYCIVMRLLQGLGSAATETASYAIAATLFPDNITAVLGILEVANGLGYVIGPPLGGVLYNVSPMLPFMVVGLFPVPVLISLFHLLPKTLGESAQPSDWAKLRTCLSRRGVVLVCAAAILGEGSFAFVEPVLEVYLQPLTEASTFVQNRLGGHHGGVGMIYAVVSVMYSAVVPAVGIASRRDRLGTRHVMVLGLGAIAFGFLLLAPSPLLAWALPKPSLTGVAFGMAFLGLGQSCALVPNMACLMEVCEDMPDTEATTNVLAGILNAAYSLGSMTAPIASSTLGMHLPFRWSTTIWASLLAAMSAALTLAWDDSGVGGGSHVHEGMAVRFVRSAGACGDALGLFGTGRDAAKDAKDGVTSARGRAVRRLRRMAQVAFLSIVATALVFVYFGEVSLMHTLHASRVLTNTALGTDSSTAAYYDAMHDLGVVTSSDGSSEQGSSSSDGLTAGADIHGVGGGGEVDEREEGRGKGAAALTMESTQKEVPSDTGEEAQGEAKLEAEETQR